MVENELAERNVVVNKRDTPHPIRFKTVAQVCAIKLVYYTRGEYTLSLWTHSKDTFTTIAILSRESSDSASSDSRIPLYTRHSKPSACLACCILSGARWRSVWTHGIGCRHLCFCRRVELCQSSRRESLDFRKLVLYWYGEWVVKLRLRNHLFNTHVPGLGFPVTYSIPLQRVAHFIHNIAHYNAYAQQRY